MDNQYHNDFAQFQVVDTVYIVIKKYPNLQKMENKYHNGLNGFEQIQVVDTVQ